MLNDFQEKINALRAFDFGQELETIVTENQDKLPEYITKQLSEGISGDGKPTTIFGRSGYSKRTVEIKEANGTGLGAVTDRVTNYMTGQFYESIKVQTEGQTFEADSDVSYFGDIRLYSPDELLEVDEENRRDFAETVTLPAITEALKAKTGFVVTQ